MMSKAKVGCKHVSHTVCILFTAHYCGSKILVANKYMHMIKWMETFLSFSMTADTLLF